MPSHDHPRRDSTLRTPEAPRNESTWGVPETPDQAGAALAREIYSIVRGWMVTPKLRRIIRAHAAARGPVKA